MDESDLQRDEVAIIKVFVKNMYIYISYIGDVNQNGAFRENESGKGTFGQKYGVFGKNGAFH